jgi:hypothetical protein
VEPGTCSDEDATGKPARSVVTVRSASIRSVAVVAVSASRSFTNVRARSADSDANYYSLRMRVRG